MENPTCTAFEEYKKVREMLPLDLMEDDITWIASNLYGTTGVLGAKAIELYNWLIRFGCALEELRFIVTNLADWMANSYPPWATYCAIISFCLVALDKGQGCAPWELVRRSARTLPNL